jgi:hypothetical protein
LCSSARLRGFAAIFFRFGLSPIDEPLLERNDWMSRSTCIIRIQSNWIKVAS